MAKERFITADIARQLLKYDSKTGILTWRWRELEWFVGGKKPAEERAARWNTRYAGNPAGSIRSSDGYKAIGLLGRIYLAHRIAWLIEYGEWPPSPLDHRDGQRSMNASSNLRPASYLENGQNRKASKNNKSGMTGVSLHGASGKWRARIMFNFKPIHLGLHDTKEAAYAAYLGAKARLHLFQPKPREA